VVKILLLGPGESGKSTVFKQMQLIYTAGFDEQTRLSFRSFARKNLLEAFQELIRACWRLRLKFDEKTEKEAAEFILQLDMLSIEPKLKEFNKAIFVLWGQGPDSDSGSLVIKAAWKNKQWFHVSDSLEYYLGRLAELCSRDYRPSDEDILRASVRTTGIVEHVFDVDALSFKFLDVGGQRSERRKWIQCFDSVTAILFIAAINAYDKVLYEDGVTNRLHESINVFESIVNDPQFDKTPVILFLNKMDLFLEKYKEVSLQKCFPEYAGCTVEDAKEFIQDKFRTVIKHDKDMFFHFTVATDTSLMKSIWKDCKAIILRDSLAQSGFEFH